MSRKESSHADGEPAEGEETNDDSPIVTLPPKDVQNDEHDQGSDIPGLGQQRSDGSIVT